ncbi:phosphate ABC transporter ATP-binding protein [Roseobacter weihaiensis]|uniref:phosphate ABC transporter ATP-binding protein n=1 Tax=Roseobacter weihaiensis TaxID=2763262 RepID=UPI001D0ACE36|nr:phosphate ABC transporter ATP-binding protein [Roseobacter sp. H9]
MFDDTYAPKPAGHTASLRNAQPFLSVRNLTLHYGEKQALRDVSFDLYDQEILAFIGPSGCGKSTALKCLNRMHDETHGVRIDGQIIMHGQDINSPDIDPPVHRRRFGWVAQKPNPFAASIYENVAYGARIHGLMRNRKEMAAHVEHCLRRAHLWEEVKDHLHKKSGHDLSGGQQQRLCIARALSTKPEILLMDEPTGSIDPVATAKIEELLLSLRDDHAVVIITHSMMQAKRIADRVAYFHLGELRELAPTEFLFSAAQDADARAFVAGRFG